MHNNYYFLRRLTTELEPLLIGAALIECFSQSKDELILRFLTNKNHEFFIRASLESSFCCLSFPDIFNRAKKNSVDLFQELKGEHVEGIKQFENERSFAVHFSHNYTLLFKMHGNRANVVFFGGDNATEIFRNHLKADLNISLKELNRALYFDYDTFKANADQLEKYYFTLDPHAWQWLKSEDWAHLGIDVKWQKFNQLVDQLKSGKFYVCEDDNKIFLSLLEIGTVRYAGKSAITAVNEFYKVYHIDTALASEKGSLLKKLNNEIKHARSYLAKNKEKLEQLTHDDHYQKWADLIMANMHRIQPGMNFIELEDLYAPPNKVHIALNPRQSPQENAERYYRKGRNQKIEMTKLAESTQAKADVMSRLLEMKAIVEDTQDVKMIRQIAKSIERDSSTKEKRVTLPYHEFDYMNFKIWVGRNATYNDQLTLKYAHKEDLWLHAKDVTGSHVVVKHQSGKKFPNEVIQRAAELAAFNSKRKTETLCPVLYTTKKYVRKRKGDPPGAVVVEREKVIMVEPRK